MSDVIEILKKDTIIVEQADNKVIVIEPKVIINQSTAGGGTWGTITGDIVNQTDLVAEFAKKMNIEPTVLPSGTNYDTVIDTGVYFADESAILIVNRSGDFVSQIYLENGIFNSRAGSVLEIGNIDWFQSVNSVVLYDGLFSKVDKVAGKGLSTNDYTNTEKDKLAGIEAGAQVNVVPTWNSVVNKPTEFPPSSHNHSHNSLDGLNANDAYQHITTDEKNLFLLSDRFRINATDFIGGTASPYQGIVIGGVPVIVKKFLNQNSYYYTTVRLPSDSVYLDNIRFILTESVMPTAGQYIDFTINGTLLRHTFNGKEVQNQMITTNTTIGYDDTGNQANTLTTSGTYLQKIGIVSMDFFYSRGI